MSTKQSKQWSVARLVLIGLLLFTVIGSVAFWKFWYRLPVGEGPAGAQLPGGEFQAVWRDKPVLLVGLGDSITAGLGARDGWGYFDRIITNPTGDWSDVQGLNLSVVLPQLSYTNLAMSGSTSLEHERRQIPRIPATDSNTLGIVVMTTGGNDLIHNYGKTPPREGAMFGATWEQAQPWIANYAERLNRMLDAINERFPGGCEVFLADIYDPTDGTGSARRVGMPPWPDGMQIHAAYNKILHEAARQRPNVHLVPLHKTFLGHGLTCRRFWRSTYRSEDANYWYWVNLEDPNERGYDAIRRVFLGTMIEARAALQ